MRIKSLVFVLSLIFVLQSCETDFELNTQWKDIPVVYGVLNPSSGVQHIRIQRAFLGEGNALTFTQIADSNFYDTAMISAKIVELNENTVVRNLMLKAKKIHRDSTSQSPFYNPASPYVWVYTTEPYPYFEIESITKDTIWFDPDHTFRIEIANKKTGKLITGTTPIVGRVNLKTPSYDPANPYINILNNSTSLSNIKWTKTGDGARYESILRFYYKEYHPGANDTTIQYVDMNFGYLTAPNAGNEFVIKFFGADYYKSLTTKIPANRDVKRIAYRFSIIMNTIGDELKIYLDLNSPSTGLIQERPLYTNMSEGYGIFSSANSQKYLFKPQPATINNIINTFKDIDNSF